ncbi:MAG: PASTA domain-containing protein, partial [Clostridia bacterium]|nr:PASTA domain-containing protein [Clostridia bacterium]
FFISEFYEGTALQDILNAKEGGFRTSETLNLLRELQTPLEAMHDAGLANGCITPERIIIEDDGTVRIKDADHVAVLFADDKEKMTESCYIPCDFYSDDLEITPASDVYSLAAIAYRMLSGKDIPKASDREYEEYLESPNESGANITDEGLEVLMTALCVYPEDRTQSVAEFLDGFEEKNETVLEIENDLTSDFSFEQKQQTSATSEKSDGKTAGFNMPAYDKKKKKEYKGIAAPVKLVLMIIFGALLIFELLAFVGIVDPTDIILAFGTTVPDVSGLTLEQAKAVLNESGLNILVVDARKAQAPSNTVFRQSPNSGKRVARGEVVCITASTGDNDYMEGVVPNVRMMTLDDAFDVVSKTCGYPVVISLVASDDVMAGCVVNQSEKSGTSPYDGTVITLTVSAGSLLQSERIKISETIEKENAAIVFMDLDLVYEVRVARAGDSLGELMPNHPSEKLHNGLDFIGWSRAPEGTGGEFTKESSCMGVTMVYAFFADRGATIATPSPEPSIYIESIDTDDNDDDDNNPVPVNTPEAPSPTEFTMSPTPSAIIITAEPSVLPTTPPPTETPTQVPTETPTEKPTETPTETPEPEPSYYLNGILFKEDEVVIKVGESKKLGVLFDGNPESKDLVFRSSNPKVVTISEDGTITGVAPGDTYVYAFLSAYGGVFETSCHIIVQE